MGAQGGNSTETCSGGKGGYSSGLITFYKRTKLLLYIGASGTVNKSGRQMTNRAYNGGGNGYFHEEGSATRLGAGGGGATDIRVGGDSLSNRIIVAGGGGGAGYSYGDCFAGGYGGGLSGGYGQKNSYASKLSEPGNQTHPGQFYRPGSPGIGGSVVSALAGGGGGGGYYGGGSGERTGASGAGGSGFICFDKKCKYPFIEGKMLAGNQNMPQFYSQTELVGHQGNGAIRITLISPYYPVCLTLRHFAGSKAPSLTLIVLFGYS